MNFATLRPGHELGVDLSIERDVVNGWGCAIVYTITFPLYFPRTRGFVMLFVN